MSSFRDYVSAVASSDSTINVFLTNDAKLTGKVISVDKDHIIFSGNRDNSPNIIPFSSIVSLEINPNIRRA